MSELIVTNDARQLVITRLACINSAVSVFRLLNGRPSPPLKACYSSQSGWRHGLGGGFLQKPPRLRHPRHPRPKPRRTRRRPLRPLSVRTGQVRLRARSNGKPCMPWASGGAWTALLCRTGCISSWGRQ
jgi:hypothetical protein